MDERSARIYRWFAWPTLVAAVLAIPDVAILQADAGEPWEMIAEFVYWATWFLFLVEIIVMLAVVPDRWRWLRSHPFDLLVVLLTPPFLPASEQTVRLMRLVRLLLVVRGVRAVHSVFSLEGLRYVGLLTVAIVLGGGAAFAEIERGRYSLWDGIWWAIETVSTVGYGDIVPTTTGGRIVATLVMISGVTFVAVLFGYLAERFVKPDVVAETAEVEVEIGAVEREALQELREIGRRVARLEAELTRSVSASVRRRERAP